MEDWAEVRRLHRAEGVPIKEITRRLGAARNTVRAALNSDRPSRYERKARGQVADAYESQVRNLLQEWPRMPASVIAERIGWPYALSLLRKRIALIRPECVGIDPVDRVVYEPGQIAQCDLWFPETKVQVGAGQQWVLLVLVMTLGFSRFTTAAMIPSWQADDILSGMWSPDPRHPPGHEDAGLGPRGRDRGTGRVTAPAAAFAGTLATRIQLAPPRDPEFKGPVERNNQYLETSFLPGRQFALPHDFNQQLADRLVRANTRTVRAIQGRPVGLLEIDYQAMTPLPPVTPPIGLSHRIRLGRDYYVRVDMVDHSVDPQVIARFVDVTASPQAVTVFCDGRVVAEHPRSWAKHQVVTDAVHAATVARMREALALDRQRRQAPVRQRTDGHAVALRALANYDAVFGVDFNPPATKAK
ncbi:transposase [Streptomyces sp. Ag109_O5-1]|nr:transposase [Streptomyces sp. Ag109_O5-1]